MLPLRSRITLWAVAIFVVVAGILGAGVWFATATMAAKDFRDALLESAVDRASEFTRLGRLPTASDLRLVAGRIGDGGVGRVEVRVAPPEELDVDSPGVRGLVDRVVRTNSASVLRPQGRSIREPGYLVAAVPMAIDGQSVVLLVSSDGLPLHKRRMTVARIFGIGLVLGIVAAGVSGWFLAGFAVRPMHTLAQAAASLQPETIEESLDVDVDSPELAAVTEELDAARERMGEAFAAQERFLSNISHELKTPIATLLVQAQTLERGELFAPVVEFVGTVEEEMRKLGRLVESFLTLTRVQGGSGVTQTKAYGANELVMDAIEDCRSMAELHAVHLRPSLAADEAGINAEIRGDPELIRTLLNNLVRNAIRFTPSGQDVRIEARVESPTDTTTDAGYFVVDVIDSGPGIHPDVLPTIFDRFVQSKTEVRRERGHGLGLAIARGIAELHGGTFSASNVESSGARFEVRLPVASPGSA